MNFKKISSLLGTVFLFLFLSYQIYINTKDINVQNEQEIIINKTFKESKPNIEYGDYLGYIEIPKYNIKRLIKKGTDKKILDEGYIGLLEGTNIEEGNTVLAGHNINKIFKELHKLENNDQVIITTYDNENVYYLTQKIEISDDDFTYFGKTAEKTLTLVTCTNKKHKRLIARFKLLK